MRMDDSLVVLQHQDMRLTLDPRRGGVIRELNWRGYHILRPTPAQAGDDPFDTACFPMVPYVNRVARGRFTFDERAVQIARNWSQDPHPLHGQGWRADWTVLTASKSNATLGFEGGGDEWPWRYSCEQRFELLQDTLSVELSVRNLCDARMPVMLGLHPYFPDAQHTQLHAQLPKVWLTDGEALPTQETQTPAGWNFEPARAVNAVALDHGFSGWNGVACLSWPRHTVMVRAPDCKFLHIYSPTGRDFFCIEPQTAPPGALSRDPMEASILVPGGRLAMRVHFTVGAT
jgi:aldose 1-epimerase